MNIKLSMLALTLLANSNSFGGHFMRPPESKIAQENPRDGIPKLNVRSPQITLNGKRAQTPGFRCVFNFRGPMIFPPSPPFN